MIKVLDHGYVETVYHMGSDEDIIRAARMSTQKGFLGWGDETKSGDEKLLRYLWENSHSTPFEFGSVAFEVRAPIFVFREWHRHRTFSYSEASARYSPLANENYVPTVERMLARDEKNKQAGTVKGSGALDEHGALLAMEDIEECYRYAEAHYQCMLKDGVPKELARLVLPMGRYSTMRVTGNLRNWLGFLTLRMDNAAQWEIRQYANVIHDELSKLFPRTLSLFDESRNA